MAVKVFRLDVIPEVSARLADVLKRITAAPVKHPAVVDILDAGIEGSTPFLAMEYVAAETLDVALRRLAPAPLEIALPLLRQVAEALEAGWAAGMGHGGLHPRDIFVLPATTESAHPHIVIRVSGLGIADALEELRIPPPVRRPYTAPEREQAGIWDIRGDVYSLGVIAHELLTGRRPTESPDLENELTGEAEPAIRDALAGALAMDPDERFATPMAFVNALAGDTTSFETVVVAAAHDNDFRDVREEPAPEPDPVVATAEEPETAASDEPESIWTPRPEQEPPVPEELPERRTARATPSRPAFLDAAGPPDVRAPFQPFTEAPKETAMPRILGVAAIVLIVGVALGYWWRGAAPEVAPDADSAPTATKVPEEPIGTEVAVKPTASPTPVATSSTPPPAAAAEPAARTGRLLVRTEPSGASVLINGRGHGMAPATIRDLPFGTYAVAVTRSGYQRREESITLSPAVPSREITLVLAPGPGAAARPTAVVAPPAVPPGTGAQTGSVRVETRPAGATVVIDGRSVGTTPLRVPELAPGSHSVRVSMAGYRTVTTTTIVRAGQQALVRLSLEIQ